MESRADAYGRKMAAFDGKDNDDDNNYYTQDVLGRSVMQGSSCWLHPTSTTPSSLTPFFLPLHLLLPERTQRSRVRTSRSPAPVVAAAATASLVSAGEESRAASRKGNILTEAGPKMSLAIYESAASLVQTSAMDYGKAESG